MRTSNNSEICPSNNCKFQFQEGELRQNIYSSNIYSMAGILRIGTPEGSEAMRYKVYDINVDFKIFESLEKPAEIIHYVDGTINIGDISKPQFKYQIVNASLTIKHSDVILDLLAEQSNNYAVNNGGYESENIESNLYFSLEPPNNWTYETYSNSYMTDFIGFGSKNAITLYPKEFGSNFLEKEGKKVGAISSFIQDTRYPIKNAPLSEYTKYKNEELGLKTILQENVTLDGQELIKIHADGLHIIILNTHSIMLFIRINLTIYHMLLTPRTL